MVHAANHVYFQEIDRISLAFHRLWLNWSKFEPSNPIWIPQLPFFQTQKMMVQTWFCTRNYVRELRIFTGKYGVLTATLRVVHLRVVCFDYIYGVITVKYGIITGKIRNSIHNPIGIIKNSKNMQKHHVSTPKSLLIPRNI